MSNVHKSEKWKRYALAQGRKTIRVRKRRHRILLLRKLGRQFNERKKNAAGLERVPLHVPACFAFAKNPNEVSELFARMRGLLKQGRKIHVSMKNVTEIGSDALVMLIAHLKDPKFRINSDITGDVPDDKSVLEVLTESGFFRHVKSRYSALPTTSQIVGRQGKRINQATIAEMITFAGNAIHGKRIKMGGIYRVYIEAMANTHDHACTETRTNESWWTTAYYDRTRQVVVFCLLDTGVGIFKSAKLRRMRDQLMRVFGIRNNATILSSILNGDLGSRTGLPYRGKGLPAMKIEFNRGQIKNLIVAANDALCELNPDRQLMIDPPIQGTFLSWEYDVKCK